jgi:hypothetical protein
MDCATNSAFIPAKQSDRGVTIVDFGSRRSSRSKQFAVGATGRKMHFSGTPVLRVRDGKILEEIGTTA